MKRLVCFNRLAYRPYKHALFDERLHNMAPTNRNTLPFQRGLNHNRVVIRRPTLRRALLNFKMLKPLSPIKSGVIALLQVQQLLIQQITGIFDGRVLGQIIRAAYGKQLLIGKKPTLHT